jgi:hypothetical protein
MKKRRALIVSLLALLLLVCVASGLVMRGYWRGQAGRELILAIKANDTNRALEALRAHADPNVRDRGQKPPSLRDYLSNVWQRMIGKDWRTTELTRTALMSAVDDDNLEMITTLLDAGAEVDARDKAGETALMIASERQLDVVKLLLARGAKVNSKDKAGWTPLMRASYNAPYMGHPAIVEVLLDRGADLNARGSLGETALMLASERHLDVVKLLLNRGAEVNAENSQRHTALDIAEHENSTETIQLLKRYGAKN